jgi:hypothetical protein
MGDALTDNGVWWRTQQQTVKDRTDTVNVAMLGDALCVGGEKFIHVGGVLIDFTVV